MKQYYEALFLSYRPRTECSKPLKKFQNHLYGHPVLNFVVRAVASVWMNINIVTLQHYKEFISFIFYLMVY